MTGETTSDERPAEKERFGEAPLGEAQSSDPPADPEMLRDEEREQASDPDDDEGAEGGAEEYGGDQDAEPSESAIERGSGDD